MSTRLALNAEPRRLHVAMIGTRGVPARYGGFETAIEEIGSRLVDLGNRVSVYCRSSAIKLRWHRGMSLVHLPTIRHKALETLAHTALSELHMQWQLPDVVIMFNAANATLLPMLKVRRVPVAVHVDGIEWKRGKWGPVGRRYYKAAERLAVRWADALIADSAGIARYYRAVHGADTVLIPYGAHIVESRDDAIAALGLSRRQYHLVVARFAPENNVQMLVEGFVRSSAQHPLIVVGDAPYDKGYVRSVQAAAVGDTRVRLVGSIWDQRLLDQLYANSLSYLHGHSVGGTNPSLLRAMGAGAPVIALNTEFNREVLENTGIFVSSAEDVAMAVTDSELSVDCALKRGAAGRERVALEYRWDAVARRYERLCRDLVEGHKTCVW